METSNKQKILVTGIKPTGRPHIGNYFGALKQAVDLQDEYRSLVMIVDYHALTTEHRAPHLRRNSLDMAIDYLAIGLDPERVILFKQSEVPEHTELAWIFNCLTTVPYLQRAHAYKDALSKGVEVSVGTFAYPLLMAADILLYDADVVPVGQDQKQHVEIARDTAEKFNRLFDDTFHLPEPLILDKIKTIPGIDGRKMSKSYNNTIPLFANEQEVAKLVMSIVTDSKSTDEVKDPEKCNVFALHKLFSEGQLPELESRYLEGKIGYKESKEILIKNINTMLTPLVERRASIAKNVDDVEQILANGASRARDLAKLKLATVRQKIGVR